MAKEYESANAKDIEKSKKKKRVRMCLICIGSLCLIWCILMTIGFAPRKTYITYHFTQDEMKYADMKIEKEYIEPGVPKWHTGDDYKIDSANKAILFLVARGNYDLDSKIKFKGDERNSSEKYGYNCQLRPYYKGFAIYGMYIVVSASPGENDDDVYTNYDFDEPNDYTLKDRERDLDKASTHWSLVGNWVAFTHGGIDETVWYDVNDSRYERDYRLCNITYGRGMNYIIDAWTGEIYYKTSTLDF